MPKKTKAKLTVVGQLLKAIRTVDRPGTVCTGGDLPLVMPGLEVEGLGAGNLLKALIYGSIGHET
jgi:hypothetical protein